MNFKDEFFKLFHSTLVFDPLFTTMQATVEDSLWHREDNVLVHTTMVMSEYCNFAPNEWTVADLCGAFACAFHDVGKPAARTEKHSEERGVYFSYPGHEQISARLWEDWAVRNMELLEKMEVTYDLFWKISWMIEYHLPYKTSKRDKVARMVETMVNLFPDEHHIFTNVLLADQFGRISDDMEVNRKQAVDWAADFNVKCADLVKSASLPDDAPVCVLLIGASGSGKSTLLWNNNYRPSVERRTIYSWDRLRLDWYGKGDFVDPIANYQAAFLASTEDSTFNARSQKVFFELLDKKVDIFVDNTNISSKRRNFFVDAAKRKGYKTVAVVFPITIDELHKRHLSRCDKHVPWSTVEQMYMSIQMPSYGEFDEIETAGLITIAI